MSDQQMRDDLVARLKALDDCPVCDSFSCGAVEEFDPNVFDFVAERLFSCGARIKVMTDGTFGIVQGCEGPLRDALDAIEQEVDDDMGEAAL